MEFDILESHSGKEIVVGKDSGKLSNPYDICIDGDGKFIQMFDNKGVPFYFDYDDLNRVNNYKTYIGNNITWYIAKVGEKINGTISTYAACRPGKGDIIYLHSFIMNHIGNGKGQNSVDHINGDTMNNRRKNLRITTQSEQNMNRGKRGRSKKSCQLPEGINQETDLERWVIYHKPKRITRPNSDHFTIEKHPLFYTGDDKQRGRYRWNGTASIKIDIHTKLKNANMQKILFDTFLEKRPEMKGMLNKKLAHEYRLI